MLEYSSKDIENAFRIVKEKNIKWLSDFIDPTQAVLFANIVNKHQNLKVTFAGGFTTAERQRVLIVDNNFEVDITDYLLRALVVKVNTDTHELKHGDFLGAILGLGIKREKLGDIFLKDKICYLIADAKIARYILDNLLVVGKYKTTVKDIDFKQLPDNSPELIEITQTVASLRLDSIIKTAWPMARSKAVDLIKAGATKLNWSVTEQPAKNVAVGDVISVRGKGRIKILEVKQLNKKGRTPVVIGKYR